LCQHWLGGVPPLAYLVCCQAKALRRKAGASVEATKKTAEDPILPKDKKKKLFGLEGFLRWRIWFVASLGIISIRGLLLASKGKELFSVPSLSVKSMPKLFAARQALQWRLPRKPRKIQSRSATEKQNGEQPSRIRRSRPRIFDVLEDRFEQ
jgi:hypothetical protein